jgi:heme a synthase
MPSTSFQKLALSTLIATLLLIMVGGLVRVSGAGLGCPDWPRCWGCWLPPAGPEEIDSNLYDVSQFNLVKMWIEYANRMVGVVIGFLILATFLHSTRYFRSHPKLFWASLTAFILVLFQAWLGGEVVKSGLRPGIITLHMVMAIILLTLLLYIAHNSRKQEYQTANSHNLKKVAGILFALTCVQVIFGTQVREALDPHIKKIETQDAQPRSEWLKSAGWKDHVHRISSWSVLGVAIFLYRRCRGKNEKPPIRRLAKWILGLVLLQIILGISLAYMALPPASQVLHLANASILICAEVLLLLHCQRPSSMVTVFD